MEEVDFLKYLKKEVNKLDCEKIFNGNFSAINYEEIPENLNKIIQEVKDYLNNKNINIALTNEKIVKILYTKCFIEPFIRKYAFNNVAVEFSSLEEYILENWSIYLYKTQTYIYIINYNETISGYNFKISKLKSVNNENHIYYFMPIFPSLNTYKILNDIVTETLDPDIYGIFIYSVNIDQLIKYVTTEKNDIHCTTDGIFTLYRNYVEYNKIFNRINLDINYINTGDKLFKNIKSYLLNNMSVNENDKLIYNLQILDMLKTLIEKNPNSSFLELLIKCDILISDLKLKIGD